MSEFTAYQIRQLESDLMYAKYHLQDGINGPEGTWTALERLQELEHILDGMIADPRFGGARTFLKCAWVSVRSAIRRIDGGHPQWALNALEEAIWDARKAKEYDSVMN